MIVCRKTGAVRMPKAGGRKHICRACSQCMHAGQERSDDRGNGARSSLSHLV
ncbi:hypothetical protein DVU_1829 [Nitratidesulfovibrio vulgaris str. Hildenborough]|uniref:Uncharacterized protein n=1 Tax=Nitratidesulfovibrio vulgaris (strain ATCC 29579 / DSM 644 / CCUG 34227 / NCIMB 8303 / VKM B-1760 / Hildenborough) TaxID=882 RepID=Q72B10_NITV2|nr:hypothetical protein DVU_1829 [Nitratidesulfovibrio vulgaris str. Hildenborough]